MPDCIEAFINKEAVDKSASDEVAPEESADEASQGAMAEDTVYKTVGVAVAGEVEQIRIGCTERLEGYVTCFRTYCVEEEAQRGGKKD